MLASRTTKTVTLRSDPSVVVTIRKLGWARRQEAQIKSHQTAMRTLIDMGGDAYMREYERIGLPQPELAKVIADPFYTHDRLTVLVGGVQSWSDHEPITAVTLADLEPDDAEFLAREILALTYPPAPTEEQKKTAA